MDKEQSELVNGVNLAKQFTSYKLSALAIQVKIMKYEQLDMYCTGWKEIRYCELLRDENLYIFINVLLMSFWQIFGSSRRSLGQARKNA